MSKDPYADRRRLTFEQAEGTEPLPAQLLPKQLSKELRAILWLIVHDSMKSDEGYDRMGGRPPYFGDTWKSILHDHHVLREHLMADDFENNTRELIEKVKLIFLEGDYVKVFGFLQFVLRHEQCPYRFDVAIDNALSHAHAAYRVLEGKTIIPIGSEAERITLEQAFSNLATTEFHGARSHLHKAGAELTEGRYADSIRESIHAVESVARTLASSGKLSEALAKLEKSSTIHGALKNGFNAIYGYASDEKGIRHPLLDDSSAKADEADALFMIGACASFVSYMIHKARSAGLLTKKS